MSRPRPLPSKRGPRATCARHAIHTSLFPSVPQFDPDRGQPDQPFRVGGRQAQYFLHGRTRIVAQSLLDKAGHRAPRRPLAPAGPALRRRTRPPAPCP